VSHGSDQGGTTTSGRPTPGRRAAAGRGASKRIRVLVGEDAYLVREGIAAGLREAAAIEVVGAEGELDSLRTAVAELVPDVVLTDIRMPPTGTNEGLRLATELDRMWPNIGVVLLSQHARLSYALELFSTGNGRRAYLLKDRIVDAATLVKAIESVVAGRPLLDASIVSMLLHGDRSELGLEELSPRETEVLALIAEGASNTAIAEKLMITRRAVERHVNSIFAKLDLGEGDVNRRVLAAMVYTRFRG
jgi:DNA-binding NarL/FixJ family response regulator